MMLTQMEIFFQEESQVIESCSGILNSAASKNREEQPQWRESIQLYLTKRLCRLQEAQSILMRRTAKQRVELALIYESEFVEQIHNLEKHERTGPMALFP